MHILTRLKLNVNHTSVSKQNARLISYNAVSLESIGKECCRYILYEIHHRDVAVILDLQYIIKTVQFTDKSNGSHDYKGITGLMSGFRYQKYFQFPLAVMYTCVTHCKQT